MIQNNALYNDRKSLNFKDTVVPLTLLTLMLIVGVVIPIFSWVTFICVSFYLIIENNNAKVASVVVFLAPLAAIFKFGSDSLSFFTIIVLIYIARCLVKQKMYTNFFIMYIFFAGFVLLGINEGVTVGIKQLVIPLFVFFCIDSTKQVKKDTIVKIFIFAIIVASVIGLTKEYIPNMPDYIIDKSLRLDANVYSDRFSGLNGDPNYYSVNLLLAFVLTVFLITKRQISNILGIALIVAFIVFGTLTSSKTFFIILALSIIISLYALLKNRRYVLTGLLILALFMCGYFVIRGDIQFFNIVINRFVSGKTISELTTGRSDYFVMYMDYFLNNPIVIFVGNGLDRSLLNGCAPHNTYIDLVYNYGLIGSGILLYLITFCLKVREREKGIIYYIPIVTVMCAYLFLSELKYADFQIHIFILLYMICKTEEPTLNYAAENEM